MTDRRALLKGFAATAGAALAPVAALGAAAATPPVRRSGRVGARRVRTVDIHAHCMVDVTRIVEGTPLQGKGVPVEPQDRYGLDSGRLAIMDRQNIDVQVLSINGFWERADRDLAARLVDYQNAQLAEMTQAYPGRFVPLATVALQHPDLAVAQLDDAFRRRGMRGVAIGCSVAGEELSSPRFDPFWRKAQELQALVFLHPLDAANATGTTKRLQGAGLLTNVIGNPLETTIALSHLIFEGVLDRFPELRICASHGGGFLAANTGRSDQGCIMRPAGCRGDPVLKKRPSEYLRQIYVDSIVFTPEALRHLVAEMGPGQIMVGTDYPYPWVEAPLAPVMATPGISDADKAAIIGGTACRLLGLEA